MRQSWSLCVCLFCLSVHAQSGISEIVLLDSATVRSVYLEPAIIDEGWDVMPEVRFWRQIIRLAPDSCILSVAATREVLFMFPTLMYDTLAPTQQRAFKDSIRRMAGLAPGTKLYVTYGKNDYYRIEGSLPVIDLALSEFEAQGLDSWYAQAILLIESPGYSRTSINGARGPFQLMKHVALKEGLTVNRTEDQRDDASLSAKAAARYIKRICIPEAEKLIQSRGQTIDHEALWFRLLVLHVYHAGAGNVGGAIRQIPRSITGIHLIRRLWHTSYRGFKNASQNYTQLVLAASLELEQYVSQDANILCNRNSIFVVPIENKPAPQLVKK